jgi:hypothetical protein
MGIMAKSMYVQTGLTRIANADGLGLVGEERESYLRQEGAFRSGPVSSQG